MDKKVLLLRLHRHPWERFKKLVVYLPLSCPPVLKQFSVRTFFSCFIFYSFKVLVWTWEYNPLHSETHYCSSVCFETSYPHLGFRQLAVPCDGRMGTFLGSSVVVMDTNILIFSHRFFFEDSFYTLILKTFWPTSSWCLKTRLLSLKSPAHLDASSIYPRLFFLHLMAALTQCSRAGCPPPSPSLFGLGGTHLVSEQSPATCIDFALWANPFNSLFFFLMADGLTC